MSQQSLAGRTVCIVDDDPLVRQYTAVELRQHGITVVEAANSAELFDLVKRVPVDCILLDFELESENGLFVQSQLRDRFVDAPPVIILSAYDNQRTIIKAFRTGASDYLIKRELRTEELLQSLQSAIERRAREDAFKGELEQLKRQSQIDETTGLYTREAIEDMVSALVTRASKTRKPFALIMVRVNGYDDVCARAGQAAGRDLIRAFAVRMSQAIRESDVCGRFDERTFAYIGDSLVNRDRLAELVDRLDRTLRFDLDLNGVSHRASATFGLALHPDDGSDLIELLNHARAELDLGATVREEVTAPPSGTGESAIVPEMGQRLRPRSSMFGWGKRIVGGSRASAG